MIGFIFPCWFAFALICIREFAALRTPRSCITNPSESPKRNYTRLTESFSDYLQGRKVFQQQNTSFTANRHQSPHSDNGTPQTTSGDQNRKSARFLLSRLIIAIMNQQSVNNSGISHVRNSTETRKKIFNEKNNTIKDERRVETNTVEPLDETSITLIDNTIEENTTESSKTSPANNKKNTANSPPIEVSLEDRSNFDVDGCPSGYAKVNGKCVPIQN